MEEMENDLPSLQTSQDSQTSPPSSLDSKTQNYTHHPLGHCLFIINLGSNTVTIEPPELLYIYNFDKISAQALVLLSSMTCFRS